MSHAEIQASLSAYLERDLPPEAERAVAAHLERCQVCARELEALRSTVELLHALPTPAPPADLVGSVMRRIRQGDGRRSWFDEIRHRLAMLPASAIAVPATAMLALALVVGVLGPDEELPIRVSLLWEVLGPTPAPEAGAAAAPQPDPRPSRPATRPAPSPTELAEAMRLRSSPPDFAGLDFDSAGPYPLVPVAAGGGAQFTGVPQRVVAWESDAGEPSGPSAEESTGDPLTQALRRNAERDRWLEFLRLRPELFVRNLQLESRAEQELWINALVERAVERGMDAEVLDILHSIRGPDGPRVARLFESSIEQMRRRASAAGD